MVKKYIVDTMKEKDSQSDALLWGSVLALPTIGALFWFLNPPQCPDGLTQAQIDSSHCVIGANIGGPPLFIILTPLVWWGCVSLVRWWERRHGTKR